MKVNLFAVMGLLFIIILPVQANTSQLQVSAPVISNTSRAKIDLNKADIETLSGAFKGIGKKRAEAIIKYRENKGGFKSIEELSQVRGLGGQFVKRHLAQLQEIFMIS